MIKHTPVVSVVSYIEVLGYHRLAAEERALLNEYQIGGIGMRVRFYIDRGSEAPHIYKHGVTEVEVEDVLARPGEDRPGADGSRVAIGQTNSGRYLRVIYVPDPEPDSIFVITAYELRGKPLQAYRRRLRRRHHR